MTQLANVVRIKCKKPEMGVTTTTIFHTDVALFMVPLEDSKADGDRP